MRTLIVIGVACYVLHLAFILAVWGIYREECHSAHPERNSTKWVGALATALFPLSPLVLVGLLVCGWVWCVRTAIGCVPTEDDSAPTEPKQT